MGRFALWLVLAALACGASDSPPGPAVAGSRAPATAWVEIGGELFELEVAADPATRHRGLSGRPGIARNGGMLFVFEGARVRAMVMRDCLVPIDVAFADASGRVVALHAMPVEPARRLGEPADVYERRLPTYSSGARARFAVETAGGRLAALGVRVGDRLVFDAKGLLAALGKD